MLARIVLLLYKDLKSTIFLMVLVIFVILVETPWTRSYHELTGIVMPFYGAIQYWLV